MVDTRCWHAESVYIGNDPAAQGAGYAGHLHDVEVGRPTVQPDLQGMPFLPVPRPFRRLLADFFRRRFPAPSLSTGRDFRPRPGHWGAHWGVDRAFAEQALMAIVYMPPGKSMPFPNGFPRVPMGTRLSANCPVSKKE